VKLVDKKTIALVRCFSHGKNVAVRWKTPDRRSV